MTVVRVYVCLLSIRMYAAPKRKMEKHAKNTGRRCLRLICECETGDCMRSYASSVAPNTSNLFTESIDAILHSPRSPLGWPEVRTRQTHLQAVRSTTISHPAPKKQKEHNKSIRVHQWPLCRSLWRSCEPCTPGPVDWPVRNRTALS